MDKQQTMIVLLSILVILQLVTAYGVFQLGKTGMPAAQPAPAAAPEPAPAAPAEKIEVSIDDDAVKGEKDAPVTIITFSDYQCPYCARVEESLKKVEEKYVNDGKVKIVFRDFPLPFHNNAQKASEASECAHDQGKFWEYHDKLFQNQNALSIDDLKKYAKELELDADKFNKCLDSGEKEAEVKKDMTDGQAAGVSGTPMSFINGEAVRGAQPYEAFEAVIEKALAK